MTSTWTPKEPPPTGLWHGLAAAYATLGKRPAKGAQLRSINDMREIARKKLPKQIFDFIDGGAGDEVTLRANRTAFDAVTLNPSSLVDVSQRNLKTTVLGEDLSLPVILGPTGLQRLVHRRGELEAAKAAGRAGTAYVMSTGSGFSIEEIADAATGPLWYQLYLWRDRELVGGLVDRAKAAGCSTLVLTVDVPLVALRDRDLRNGMSVPPRVSVKNVLEGARKPRWVREFLMGPPITFGQFRDHDFGGARSDMAIMEWVNKTLTNPSATWDEMEFLRDKWPGKLIVKGVLGAEDAARSVAMGADGVVVSNHGGRQLDGAPATLDVLPEVVKEVGDRCEVLFDGGIRRGVDVVKAMAMGAKAVMIGRPYWWGLTLAGSDGVEEVIEIFRRELELTMALTGYTDVNKLDADAIAPRPITHSEATFRP